MTQILSTFDAQTWALIGLAFFVAGVVKGVTGQGLPSVVLALLTVAIGLKAALALLVIPTFVTNVWQALQGPALVAILRRIWLLLATACAGVWLGVGVLAATDARIMTAFMGIVLAGYGAFGLARPVLPRPPARHEIWLAPTVGSVNGVLAGMTGSLAMPGVPYMQALGFDKNTLVQGMGLLFTIVSLSMAAAMSGNQLLSPELAGASLAGIVPALLGMRAGQAIRNRLSEETFKRVMFCALIAIGLFIGSRSLM
jgi:uncharacterized membrane protein YfcA